MPTFIASLLRQLRHSMRHPIAMIAVSNKGWNRRLGPALFELVPQLLFYTSHGVILFTLFRSINGQLVDPSKLWQFFLIMCCVDSMGDALFFKGLWEYCASLRRGFPVYYLTAPGSSLAKVLCLRFDVPMFLLGLAFGLVACILAFVNNAPSVWMLPMALGLGIFTHIILTSAFHIIQAYFDPTLPLGLGSPASRLYTKPLHLVLNQAKFLLVLAVVYPAFFITAYPAGLASSHFAWSFLNETPWVALPLGLLVISPWVLFLNFVVARSCRKWA